jgi:putative transposase
MPTKTFRYRLYPSKAQREVLNGQLRICCELFNAAIQERRDAWRMAHVSVGYGQQSAQLPGIKAERPDVAGVYGQVLQDVLRRVDRAFSGFFRRLRRGERAGYPRFRSQHRFDSLTYPQARFSVTGRHLSAPKVGLVKIKQHRPMLGKVKTLTIKREAGKWFACFTVECADTPLPTSTESVGIDVGLAHFATLSDGAQIENQRYARQSEAKIRRAQRRIARRDRGSAGRREAVRLFQSAHARVRHQRADAQHKLSRMLVNRYGLIAVEDLNMRALTRTPLAKSINDAGWSSFIYKLTYKAESAGRVLVKVDPRGTSQTCLCGARVPKAISERWHDCHECGLTAPRDQVSAQLILGRGLRLHSETWAQTPCVL